MAEQLLGLVAYCALMSGTPGPNNVMLAASGANFGYRRTFPHLLGISVGGFGLTALMCLGLGAVFTKYPAVGSALKVFGSLYLVYLAWRLAGTSDSEKARSGRPLSFLEGAGFQVLNPTVWLRAATCAAVFMPSSLSSFHGALLVSSIGFSVSLPLNSGWTLFGLVLAKFLSSPRRLKTFNAVMGLLLLALALGVHT